MLLWQRRIDLLLERPKWLGACQLRAVDVECWPKLYSGRHSSTIVVLHELLVFVCLHTAAEGRGVEAKIFGESRKRHIKIRATVHAILACIQHFTHWPELALIGGAFGSLASAQRAVAKLKQVAIYQFDLASRDIIPDNLGFSFHNVESAGRSKEI